MDTKEFWSRVEKTDGCWLWTGYKSRGYGLFAGQRAHRRSWEIHNGPIPRGMMVCHHCDNPPCVRPDHLFIGTAADNVHDAIQKGRRKTCRPHRSTHCRRGHELTDANVYTSPTSGRECRQCKRDRDARRPHRIHGSRRVPA